MAFLGGKYLQPEQVMTGNVQTFRAREAATGRSVFVHRIAETAQPEQAALLKLLLSCLYRSSTVKELVLDVREEGDLCFVVTESVPQCLLLREWLQFESDRSDPGTKPAGGEAPLHAPVPAAPQRPAPQSANPKPLPQAQAHTGPGEFTRMFQTLGPSLDETVSKKIPASVEAPVRPVTPLPPEAMRPQSRPEPPPKPKIATPTPGAPASPGEFTRLFRSPVSAAPTAPPPAKKDAPANPLATKPPLTGQPPGSDPHEFTRLFQTPAQPSVAEHGPTAGSPGPAVPNPKPEPGEFTRFFGGGSPAPHPHGRPLPEVQRPLSPQNAATPPQSPGEFTQLFSGQGARPIPPAVAAPPYSVTSTPIESFRHPRAAGPSGTAGEFTRIFEGGTERPSSPGASAGAGEYTQLFGTNNPARVSPPAQPAFAADPLVSPLSEPGPPMQPRRPVPPGPSEFTRVVMGPGAAQAEPPPAISTPPSSAPPFASGVPGGQAPSMPAMPSAPAIPAGPAVPPVSPPALRPAKTPNKALLLLFLILFILAAALVIVIATGAKH